VDQEAGKTGERFPVTRTTLLQQIRSPDQPTRERAMGAMIQVYWRPVYGYLRIRWGREPADAEDLAQEFFLRAMEGDYFEKYDPAIARFRTFLRICLDGFMANTERAAGRKKRGGGSTWLSLDFELAEAELAGVSIQGEEAMDRFFHEEWVRSVLSLSVAALRDHCAAHGKGMAFEVFSRYDIDAIEGGRPTYQALADDLRQPVTQITNLLAYARREFRTIVLDMLRELTASEDEFQAEASALLGLGEAR
jgi:DNA-directed RNA polymerase specialized sigma24 family protein